MHGPERAFTMLPEKGSGVDDGVIQLISHIEARSGSGVVSRLTICYIEDLRAVVYFGFINGTCG